MQYLVTHDGRVCYDGEDETEARKEFESARYVSRYETGADIILSIDGKTELEFIYPVAMGKTSSDDGEDAPTILDFLEGARGDQGDIFEVERYGDPDSVADGDEIGYGRLDNVRGLGDLRSLAKDGRLLVYVPSACSGSDYNGGALARSNVRALESLAKGDDLPYHLLHGNHGTHGIAFPLWCRSKGLLEQLEGLSDYPVVDDETMGEVEREDETEAWDNWARSDWRKALEKETGVDLGEVSNEELARTFHEACEEAGRYFEHGEEGPWIDCEKLAKGAERAKILAIPGAVSDTLKEEQSAIRLLDEVSNFAKLERVVGLTREGDTLESLELCEELLSRLEPHGIRDCRVGPVADVTDICRQVADWPLPRVQAIGGEFDSLAKDCETEWAKGGGTEEERAYRSRLWSLARELRELSAGKTGADRETVELIKRSARTAVRPLLEGKSLNAEALKRWSLEEGA